MSSAMNHRLRSRRSYYRAMAFLGGRRAVLSPTLPRESYKQFFRMLGRGMTRNREAGNERSPDIQT